MKFKKLSRKKSISLILAVVIILILIAIGIFLFTRNQNGNFSFNNSPEAGTVQENEELLAKIGKLIKLPDETPDIATVTDVNQLQKQSVFRNAQNGDKVLIYKEAKRAIVYRPSENIIIEVGNIVVSPQSSASATLEGEQEITRASVVVLNATSIAGYAGRIGDELSSKFSNLEVINTGNAVGDYDTTLVIDLTGENEDSTQAIADELNGEVGELPEDEEDPDSDILVILAQ